MEDRAEVLGKMQEQQRGAIRVVTHREISKIHLQSVGLMVKLILLPEQQHHSDSEMRAVAVQAEMVRQVEMHPCRIDQKFLYRQSAPGMSALPDMPLPVVMAATEATEAMQVNMGVAAMVDTEAAEQVQAEP